MLSAVTTFSACLRRQVVYLVCGCMLCMCVRVPDVLVCGMFGCELSQVHILSQFTTKHPTDKYIRHTHTHTQHTATYQINNLTTQTSREGSNSTKHERRPPEDGQTIVTETCRVLIDVFYKHF